MPQLDITTFSSQIFWLVVCFSILCVMMATVVVPRISRALTFRYHHIQQDLAYIRDLEQEMSSLQKERETLLKEARHEIAQMLRQSVEETTQLKQEKLNQFESDLAHQLKHHQKCLEDDKKTILAQTDDIILNFVQEISLKLLDKSCSVHEIEPYISASSQKQWEDEKQERVRL
ncbi:MAG: hypothetical protein HYS39_01230 [Proteobacteria bacterium]|nr:hypothetical protein [Pseudomonadota bacterium]